MPGEWTMTDHDLLSRIDERTETMCEKIDALIKKQETEYVTKSEFLPVKSIVYAGSGTVLLAVIGAIVALVVRGGHT